MATATHPLPTIHQIKVTLQDSKPPIWRRLLVHSDIGLYWLHQVIQVAMGWEDYHLHQFIVGREYYTIPHPDYMFAVKDERRYSLADILPLEGMKCIYEYDFGDCWNHVILVEKIVPIDPQITYPVCIKGRRACPPEDIGGVWGYEHFLEAIQDPQHPDHNDFLEWIDAPFDPTAFNLDEVNQRLRKIRIPKRKKRTQNP